MTVKIQSSIHPSSQNMLILWTQICIFQIFIKSEPFHTFTDENLEAHFKSEWRYFKLKGPILWSFYISLLFFWLNA